MAGQIGQQQSHPAIAGGEATQQSPPDWCRLALGRSAADFIVPNRWPCGSHRAFRLGQSEGAYWCSGSPQRLLVGYFLLAVFRHAGEGCDSSAFDHMPDGEVAERHRRSKRQAGLVADTMLGGGGDIARGVKARNGMTPLVDHLSSNVSE